MQFIEAGYIDDPDYPLDIKAVWSGILSQPEKTKEIIQSLDPKVLILPSQRCKLHEIMPWKHKK